MKFVSSAFFNCDERTFWDKIFFDPTYAKALYVDELQFVDFKILELTGEPGSIRTRKMLTEPKSEAPAVVNKLIGGSISYTEEGKYDPATGLWTFRITTSKLADKVSISGKLWCEKRGDKKIERFIETDLTVNVFGVGGVVEKYIEAATRESYTKTERFTNAWIEKNGL